VPSLLLDVAPQYLAVDDAESVDRLPMGGIFVNAVGLTRALLKYGTFDRYYYLDIRHDTPPLDIERDDRLTRLTLANIETLSDEEELVLFRGGPNLSKYVPFRASRNRFQWPICGVTHGVGDPYDLSQYVCSFLLSLRPYDAIICTSDSVHRALIALLKGLQRCSSLDLSGHEPQFLETPQLPLGVKEEGITLNDKEEARRLLGIPPSEFVLLYFGRLSVENKCDFHPLIAWFATCSSLPTSSILLIGGHDLGNRASVELRRFSARVGGHSVMIWPNPKHTERRLLLSAADAFVSLSDTTLEAFGLTVVEAMLAGLPVLASEWNGYKELVRHGQDGFLIPTTLPEDTRLYNEISSLADMRPILSQSVVINMHDFQEYCTVLARNKPLRLELGAAARKRAEELYSWRTLVPRYEAQWRHQLAEGAAHQCGKQTCEPGEASFIDYAAVFAHYASGQWGDKMIVRCGDLEPRIERLFHEGALFSDTGVDFRCDVDRFIVERLRNRDADTIGDLIHGCLSQGQGWSELLVRAQVGRLLKYGVLALAAVGAKSHRSASD
jgi:D-inositol-3-phosphate glycosyltransferase